MNNVYAFPPIALMRRLMVVHVGRTAGFVGRNFAGRQSGERHPRNTSLTEPGSALAMGVCVLDVAHSNYGLGGHWLITTIISSGLNSCKAYKVQQM
ncbi:hypothetical protein M3J09_000806 [Ascochyta lentis]